MDEDKAYYERGKAMMDPTVETSGDFRLSPAKDNKSHSINSDSVCIMGEFNRNRKNRGKP